MRGLDASPRCAKTLGCTRRLPRLRPQTRPTNASTGAGNGREPQLRSPTAYALPSAVTPGTPLREAARRGEDPRPLVHPRVGGELPVPRPPSDVPAALGGRGTQLSGGRKSRIVDSLPRREHICPLSPTCDLRNAGSWLWCCVISIGLGPRPRTLGSEQRHLLVVPNHPVELQPQRRQHRRRHRPHLLVQIVFAVGFMAHRVQRFRAIGRHQIRDHPSRFR